jgi:PBSX family phage portal protein
MTDQTANEVSLNVEPVGKNAVLVEKATDSQQLDDRRIKARKGLGRNPPYNPDRLASFLELNETHAVAIRKKARYEVGFGFDVVPHPRVGSEDASEDERDIVEGFWHGPDSRWQTGPKQSAEPTTAIEVLELARQDYHSVGWCCLEILVNLEGDPIGLAHVPANTVRVRKPADGEDLSDARGYVQRRAGKTRYFGEAGDRYRGEGENDDRDPLFVDSETGDIARGSATALDNEPANELIFVRNPNPLELHYGVPDWVSAIRTITGDEAAKDYNREFFRNDTIPRMAIKVTGGTLSEESREDLRTMLDNLREESHRAVILEVEKFADGLADDMEIEIEPISQGITEEMSFQAFREKNEHDIAKVHEVPPILIGVTQTSNRSNSKEQVAEFATDIIAPEQHKFAERLYRLIHQQALGVTDWTIEFELRGADQPKEDAEVARRKIQAVNGAITVDRALEMIGEDPLPDDHPVSGDTLVADVGNDTRPPGFDPPTERAAHLPPTENKVGERDWDDVEAALATKAPLETVQFSSSNLDEGLYDFGERELFLSFKREGGSNSLYAYVDVPASEWSGLVNASSAGSYHYDNIRLDYPYIEITNFHDRLPEGPAPSGDDVPEGVPSEI